MFQNCFVILHPTSCAQEFQVFHILTNSSLAFLKVNWSSVSYIYFLCLQKMPAIYGWSPICLLIIFCFKCHNHPAKKVFLFSFYRWRKWNNCWLLSANKAPHQDSLSKLLVLGGVQGERQKESSTCLLNMLLQGRGWGMRTCAKPLT